MKSKRPYLIRATLDWLADSGMTQVVAVRLGPGVCVPKLEGVAGSLGAFLLTPSQAKSVRVDEYLMAGVAQVAAKDEPFSLPVSALVSICCVETGHREVFDDAPFSQSVPLSSAPIRESGLAVSGATAPRRVPQLTLVKN